MKKAILPLLLTVFMLGACSTDNTPPNTPPNSDSGNGDSGKEEPGNSGTKLFSHINELADNVDETPSFFDRKEEKQLNRLGLAVDVTDPNNNPWGNDNNVNYNGAGMTPVESANDIIVEIKEKKNLITANVQMLDTWIDWWGSYLRISYDDILDEATFYQIYLFDYSWSYYEIKSRYDDGDICIKYLGVEYNILDDVYSRMYLTYKEGVGLSYEASFNTLDRYYFEKNDDEEHPVVKGIVQNCVHDDANFYHFDIKKLYYEPQTEYQNEFAYSQNVIMYEVVPGYSRNPEEGTYDYNTMKANEALGPCISEQLVFFGNKAHEPKIEVFDYRPNWQVHYLIEAYELDGIKSIIYDMNDVNGEDNIQGGEMYVEFNKDDIPEKVYMEVDGVDQYVYVLPSGALAAVSCDGYYGYPSLRITLDKNHADSKYLLEAMDFLGISFKDESFATDIARFDTYGEELSGKSYFGVAFNNFLKPSYLATLIDKYALAYSYIDNDAIESYDLANNSTPWNEQVEDENFYNLYSHGVTGTATLDLSSNALHLSDISVTLTNSPLIEKHEQYILHAALVDENGQIYEFETSTGIYDGTNDVTISLYDIDNLGDIRLNRGTYKLVTYLTDNNNKRISSIYYPMVNGSNAYIHEPYHDVYRFTCDETEGTYTFVIGQDYDRSLDAEASIHTYDYVDYLYLNMLNFGININSDAIFDGEEITYQVLLDDGTNPVLLYEKVYTKGFTGLYATGEDICISNKDIADGEYDIIVSIDIAGLEGMDCYVMHSLNENLSVTDELTNKQYEISTTQSGNLHLSVTTINN